MARKPKGGALVSAVENGDPKKVAIPRSRAVAMNGIHNSHECAALISALHADLSLGAVTPTVANAHANLVAKTLKLKELEQKYGQPYSPGQKRLQLAPS